MQQLLITCLLLLCVLSIYWISIAKQDGLQIKQQRSHEQTMDYVRGIDA